MTPEFADLADVARRVTAAYASTIAKADCLVVPAGVWEAFGDVRDCAKQAVRVLVERDEDDVVAQVAPLTGSVLIVDAGVVTGRTVAAIADAARRGGATSVGLIVGVLPRTAAHALRGHVDEMHGLVEPLGQRDLRWHIGGLT